VAGRDVVDWLARHGIAAEPHAYVGTDKGAGMDFLDRASRFDADLVVAGGYGHSRLREYVLGGFTRDLLHSSDVCCLMSN
jgi:nucleotide-binding universal stress UspA family protein